MEAKNDQPNHKDRTTPHWKSVEKVVRLLEATLDPSATVQHDVALHDYSSGGPRQCDTVIETGIAPRRTRTIVEVQDRADPLGIEDLQGFSRKMEGVRAQHLICVTRVGYTGQARNFARNVGPSIRLLTLAELEQSSWPVNIAFGRFCIIENEAKPVHMQLRGAPNDNYALERQPGRGNLDLQARMFEYRKRGHRSKVLTASDLFLTATDEMPFYFYQPNPIPHQMKRRFGSDDRLWVKIGKRRFCVGEMELHVLLQTRKHFIPVKMMSYTQQDFEGLLGWSALAEGELDGKRIQIRAAFKPGPDNRLQMYGYEIDGVRRAAPMFFAPLATEEQIKAHAADIAAYEGKSPDCAAPTRVEENQE